MNRIFTLPLLFVSLTCAAQQGSVDGIVSRDEAPVPGAIVSLEGTALADTTDETGRFDIPDVPYGTYVLTVGLEGYERIVRSVKVTGHITVEYLSFSSTGLLYDGDNLPVVSISESGEIDESGIGVAGILSASRDAFESAASFKFSAARFRLRGYDNENFVTYMNGAPMTDLTRGRTMFYLWSGMNDMVRNRETAIGLSPAGFSFGAVGGAYQIDSRAAGQRKQAQFSFSASNRSYANRVMGSYGTGILPSGWSFALSGSRRWANEGYVDGTFYDSWSYFASAEKTFGTNHSLALTVFGAPSRTGLSSASVQEMQDLAGTPYYNPNWGYQNGSRRNARVRKGHQPAAILTHDYEINERTSVYSALGYVTGKSARSSLEWYAAPDPRPDYYKNLPSYYYSLGFEQAGDWLTQLLKNNEEARQINWDRIYQANFLSADTAVYLVGDRVTKNDIYSFNSTLTHTLSDHTTLNGGLTYIRQSSNQYKELNDLLGAQYHIDINKFARQDFPDSPDAYQNDLNNADRKVVEGEKFEYDYTAHIQRPSGWLQGRFELDQVDMFIGAELASVSFYRDGHYRNGLFPDSSYGKSTTQSFFNYSFKGGLTYKLNGRNYMFVRALTGTRAPAFEDGFVSPRTRNQVVPGLENEKLLSFEGGYQLNTPRVKLKLVGFLTKFSGGTHTTSFLSESNDAFVNYTQTGIETTHRGIEAGLDANLSHGWSVQAAAAVGEYYYTARPVAVITQDNLASVIAYDDTVFIKNLHVAGTPQSAYTAGVSYRSPKYWFFNISVNYFDRTFIDYFPGRRNRDALDLVEVGSDDWVAILSQEQVSAQMTIDLFAGWSWKLNNSFKGMERDRFLVFHVGVNNLLNNQDLITGGYEYSRFDQVEDLEVFKPKYYYAYGTTYYVNVAFRFN